MILLRIFPILVLLAACGPRFIAVAPGTPTIPCAAARLAARGWVVDTAYTDSVRIRVVKHEARGNSVDTVTAELIPPPSTSLVRMESRWWYGEGDARRHMGQLSDGRIEMRYALKSCGVDAWGSRPMPPLVACFAQRLQDRGWAVDTLQPNVIVATTRMDSSEVVVRAALLPPSNDDRVIFTSDLFAVDDGRRRFVGTHPGKQAEVRNEFTMCGGYGYTNRPEWKGPLPGRRP